MTEVFVLFNYFRWAQSFPFAIRKTFAAMRENPAICVARRNDNAKQSRDCMQRTRVVKIACFVVLLRMRYGRGGISMAPTAYATAADEVSKSARLWTIV